MSSHDKEQSHCDAYEKILDLDLFNALLALVVKMSDNKDAMLEYSRFISQKSLWASRCNDPGAYFAQHELRYIGEITERFEERIGSRPEIFRALALALGFALPFLTDSMFVGTQREDFIRRLDKEAGNDLYLQGARYLLTTDPMERKQLRSQLAGDTYQRTEDAMFVLSLFDPQEDEFPAMHPQIARLWGVDRTIPLLGNGRMLDWLLCNYKPVIAECRKKDNAVLRALLKLPGQFCKEGSALYKTLIDSGYSTLEIRYANSWMIWPCQNPVGLNPNGIPAEKAAAQFCIAALNQDEELPDEAFTHMERLYSMYRKFHIRYEGHEGIWPAVSTQVNPTNPKTVLWMIQKANLQFSYRFDVFDPQWDILAEQLEPLDYRNLFIEQVDRLEAPDKKEIRRYMERYQELTGLDYMEAFQQENGWYNKNFALLVDADTIDLWSFFQSHLNYESEPKEKQALCYVQEYTAGSRTRKAFDFNKKLLETYDVTEYPDLFESHSGFHRDYMKSIRYYYSDLGKLDFKRDFLSSDEQRQLFEWIDTSQFCLEPQSYYNFVEAALWNDCVRALYDKETLREVLKALIATRYNIHSVNSLKQDLYTQEELDAEKEQQQAEWERIRQERRANSLATKKERLDAKFDGSVQSLKDFLDSYYSVEDRRDALSLIDEPLHLAASQFSYPITSEQAGVLLYLCGRAIDTDAIPRKTLYSLIEIVIKEERANATNC